MPVLKNAKHELFAQSLALGKTADQSYIDAGYSEHRSNAARLSANEPVRRRIEEIQSKAAEKVGVTVESIVDELRKIGFADITKAVQWGEAIAILDQGGEATVAQGVAMVPSAELPSEVSAAISEVRKTKDGILIKFHDKRAALVDLGKHVGMFGTKVEHSGSVTLVHENALRDLE